MLVRESDWSTVNVCVAGFGVAGYACADALMQLGARVSVIDSGDSEALRERAMILGLLGVEVHLNHQGGVPDCDVLVVSPGLRPSDPWILEAVERGIMVWGELELAWRLRRPNSAGLYAPWLCITGTNGKTTATMMLASMLEASGARTVAAGNIGTSLVDVVMHEDLDVIAVEVGAPQLPFVQSMSPLAAACLNIADDHIDHFGSMTDYVAAKALIFERCQLAVVYNVEDPITLRLAQEAEVVDGCRGVGFTLGSPGPSMLGVVEDLLVDRAFVENRADSAEEIASVHDVKPLAPHNIANALAAAALARAYGVPASAVHDGLQAFTPAPHRIALVAEKHGVRYIDDSKATNAHAALTSLRAYRPVVWIAGGMAKGQDFDDLVREVAPHLRAAVLLGVDRDRIGASLARHAPDVPVVTIDSSETVAMTEVVAAARAAAQPGDTVLLAPGCASWDMFRDYGHRGDLFVEAVSALAD